jgi:hypothetical protein
MASSEARRQKKLNKKKNKRQQKHATLQRRHSTDPGVVLKGIETFPIYDVRVPKSMWEVGMGNVVIARWTPDRNLVVGVYLLDTFYLGIKNASWLSISLLQYSSMINKLTRSAKCEMQQVKPEYLAKLLVDMEAWALSMTHSRPHADYGHARKLLAGIDPTLCSETFSFGREGKPLFISGPPSDWGTEDFDDEEDMFFDEDELDEGIKQVDASQYKVY